MKSFEVQIEVSIVVSKSIKADSFDEALEDAKVLAAGCPVENGLVKVPSRVTYQWQNDSKIVGIIS